MDYPKVLVGVPVCDLYEYCFEEFINNIKNLTYPNYEILLIDNSKEETFFNKLKSLNLNVIRLPYLEKMRARVVESHNKLREYALKENFDYLLILDQDIITKNNVIEQLTSNNKDAISALYFGHHLLPNGENRIMPFAWKFQEKKGDWSKIIYLTEEDILNNNLIGIAFTGMGCVLLSKNVLTKIKFRYDTNIEAWDDRWFGYDLDKEGIYFYVDPRVKCKHLYLKRPFNYHEIKKQGLV